MTSDVIVHLCGGLPVNLFVWGLPYSLCCVCITCVDQLMDTTWQVGVQSLEKTKLNLRKTERKQVRTTDFTKSGMQHEAMSKDSPDAPA